jgi:hypothetical protein
VIDLSLFLLGADKDASKNKENAICDERSKKISQYIFPSILLKYP